MRIKYLGTGAAERIPAIFCKCKICENARINGEKEIRTQNQLIIDDNLLIEFPGDSYLHMLKYNLDLAKYNNLLISHWHSDHFYGEDLAYRMSGYSNEVFNKLHVYGNKTVKKFYDRAFELEERMDNNLLEYHTIKPYEYFNVDKYTVHALPTNHGWYKQDCFIYVIDDGMDTFLYTHDSGYFTEEMFLYLEKQKFIFSIVSLDCTGQVKEKSGNHMNWEDNLRLIKELKLRGLATIETKFIINHFSHNGGLTHEEMSKLAKVKNVITSYDGMEIDVDSIHIK